MHKSKHDPANLTRAHRNHRVRQRPGRLSRRAGPTPPARQGGSGCGFLCGPAAHSPTACAALHIQRFATDALEVIAAPDVDAVVILTSMTEHARLARAALE